MICTFFNLFDCLSKKYKCKLCPYKTKEENQLTSHVFEKHLDYVSDDIYNKVVQNILLNDKLKHQNEIIDVL